MLKAEESAKAETQRQASTGKKKKNAQRESCELSFIGGKMRTIAQETAFQIALRNCSKDVGGKVSIYVILVKGEYMYSSRRFPLVS